jgi:hypothetical protein
MAQALLCAGRALRYVVATSSGSHGDMFQDLKATLAGVESRPLYLRSTRDRLWKRHPLSEVGQFGGRETLYSAKIVELRRQLAARFLKPITMNIRAMYPLAGPDCISELVRPQFFLSGKDLYPLHLLQYSLDRYA